MTSDTPEPARVRPAAPADLETLVGLVHQYFDFYGRPRRSDEVVARLIRRIQSDSGAGRQLLAEKGGEAVGFATLYFSFSTLRAARMAVLNDLYVRPDHRRGGVGTALFQACLALVREGDFSHMEWVTAPENRAAHSFYERMGAAPTDWVVFEL